MSIDAPQICYLQIEPKVAPPNREHAGSDRTAGGTGDAVDRRQYRSLTVGEAPPR